MAGFAPILVSDEDPSFGELAGRYAVRGFPTVAFTRADGTLVESVIGAAPPAAFGAVAERALAAAR